MNFDKSLVYVPTLEPTQGGIVNLNCIMLTS